MNARGVYSNLEAQAGVFNPLNSRIKIKILLCRPYSFTIEVVRRS